MRRLVLAAVLAALAVVPTALAAGISPPVLTSGTLSVHGLDYHVGPVGDATRIEVRRGSAVRRSVSLPGRWGLAPAVFGGAPEGISHDGSTLVLAEAVPPTGELRAATRMLVVRTARLSAPKTLRLRGDFSIDALSPKGRFLYLIQHTTDSHYVVRAYDLQQGKLLPRTIADKRQRGWQMSGWPVSRAVGAGGRWVYTLYTQQGNYPFVHALDTVGRTAVCIGIPWSWGGEGVWNAHLSLDASGRRLTIADRDRTAVLDTKTFRLLRS